MSFQAAGEAPPRGARQNLILDDYAVCAAGLKIDRAFSGESTIPSGRSFVNA